MTLGSTRLVSMPCAMIIASYSAKPITEPWHIAVKPVSATWLSSDSHKTVTIELTNEGNEPLWVRESNPLNDYEVAVTDLHGKIIPMTQRGLQIPQGQRSTLFRTLRKSLVPGESYTTAIDLADLFDFPPGKYKVHVKLISYTQNAFDGKTKRRKSETEISAPSGSTPIEVFP